MSKRIFNIVRPREYQSNGETKTAWDRHGVMIVDGGKISMRLESIPIGSDWNGWFNVFERDDQQQGQQQGAGQGYPGNGQSRQPPRNGSGQRGQPQPSNDFDDDIPF